MKKGNPKKLTTYADIAKDHALKVAVVSGANNVDFLPLAVGVKEDQIVFILPMQMPSPLSRAAPMPMPPRASGVRTGQGPSQCRAGEAFVDPVVKDAPVRNFLAVSLSGRRTKR